MCFLCFIQVMEYGTTYVLFVVNCFQISIFAVAKTTFDLANRRITFPATITKNHREKTVQLPAALENVLQKYLEKVNISSYSSDLYLFSRDLKPGKEQMYKSYASRKWKLMRQELDLPLDCKMYALKQTGITENLNSGIAFNNVRNQCGHEKADMTAYYARMATEKSFAEIRSKGVCYGVSAN